MPFYNWCPHCNRIASLLISCVCLLLCTCRALSKAADDGLLTSGFFWIPSLGGPTSMTMRQAVSHASSRSPSYCWRPCGMPVMPSWQCVACLLSSLCICRSRLCPEALVAHPVWLAAEKHP
jgi:hypothetical protein